MITVAVAKGRVFDESLELLAPLGLSAAQVREDSRSLIHAFPKAGLRLLVVRSQDVPTYVESGAAELGIVGKDVLLEAGSKLFELFDLGIGACRLSLAMRKGDLPFLEMNPDEPIRVATKYTNLTAGYLNRQGRRAEIVKLNGSVELAPLVGLADRICDLVSTGSTLKANGLVEDLVILESTCRLVANPAALKMKPREVRSLAEKIGGLTRQ